MTATTLEVFLEGVDTESDLDRPLQSTEYSDSDDGCQDEDDGINQLRGDVSKDESSGVHTIDARLDENFARHAIQNSSSTQP
ncbi:hypothetical protein pipiens_020529 [Culex pipiens pipiens]|uniref:Uncharacterized protein n=1 Tax=Culex pipiens pipiens TaxID=38569 RepID=A0ABD1DSJ2_CULPP